jgi:adenylylsulfate kinase
MRELAKNIIGAEDFLEVFVDTPLEVCEERDVKGLYKKARKGEIKEFTGVSAPYEAPENPALVLNTAGKAAEESAQQLLEFVLPSVKPEALNLDKQS